MQTQCPQTDTLTPCPNLPPAVGAGIPPWTRLVDFVRERVKLPGTKALCREGGCGVCTVVVTVPDPETAGRTKTYSVQAVSGVERASGVVLARFFSFVWTYSAL